MAILTSKDRKKLNNAAKKKKNTDTGRTAAEKQRKKSVAENAAAEKKKNKSSASKKKTTSSSVLNDTEKKEVEEIRRRTQSLRDRNNAVSQRDAYDSARRKAYGERQSSKESKTKIPSLFDESKSKSGSLSLEDQKKNVQGIRRNAEEVKDRNYWLFNNGANKPVERKANVPLQTQMTTEEIARRKSVEANQPLGFRNEGQYIATRAVMGVPRDLIGAYDKAVNVPTADYYLNDKYRRFMNGGVKAPVYMGINQQKTAEYEAQAKREGYNSLEEWQIAKANEAMAKTDGYYAQKKEVQDAAQKAVDEGKMSKWALTAGDIAEEIGAMTPTMATAGAAGGIAKLIGLGGKAAWAFQNLLMGAEISGSVSGLEAKEMYNAVLNQKQNMIAFMGEDAYKAKTGNDGLTIDDYRDALKRANNTGELVGMAEAATEMLFGGIPLMGKGIVNKIGGKIGFELLSEPTKQQIRTFRNTIGGRIAKQVTERLGGTLGEGTEEAIMAVAQPYIETNVAGVESDVSIEDIIHDFGMGAAVSLILGMPVNAVNDTMIAYDAVQQRRQNKDFIKAAEERVNELVNEGQMTEEDAAASVREVRDILSGKGSLRVSDEAGYEEKTTSDTLRIYDSAEEAQKSLENEFTGKKIGDEVKGAYFDGDTVREFTAAKTEEGVKYRTADTTEGDIETYRAKADKVKSAQNETERSGYQLNVKEDIIKEVSALSKALGRTIVFDEEAKTYNEDGSANVTRGWFDEKDGSIHVNIHNETPAATVVAHEITHSLEGTKAYAAMQKAVFDYYRSSLGAERKERGTLYIEGGKTLESEKDVDYEVMANFVETKLLTDKETINYIVKRNKTFGEKIVNGINRMIQRKIGSKEQKFLAGIRTKWEAALEESRKEGDKKGHSGDIAGKVKERSAEVKKKGQKKYSLGKEKRKVSAEMGELIKAYNAEMMGVFYERSSADRRKLWDMIHEEMVHAIETGAGRNEKIREIITFAYETGYRMENQEPSSENTWGGGIYVPKEYRGEMDSLGGLRTVNRKMMGSGIYFTYEQYKKGSKTKYGGIDEAYAVLREANPMMEDLNDPALQVEAIVDFFSSGKGKQTLKDMDDEFFYTDFVKPYKDDISKTVEKAFDDISTLARYEMTEKARKEGEEAGEKKGIEKGKKEASKEYAAEQKKEKKQQAKEEKKRVDAQRKADESTMRMHDRLVKEIQDEADRKYAAEQKKKEKERQKMDEETLKEHDRLMKEEERKRKKEVKEELNKQAKEYKESQKAERKSYEEIIKGQEKQKKKLEKEMDQQERQKKRDEDYKRDKERRGERIKAAQQEAKRRREKPEPGSTKSMYLNNKSVRKLCFEFRTEVISRLVEMGLFTDTNGIVVIDNNGMEVAWKTTYGKWEASNKKNEYTPYWGLTTLAEKEGIDADTFYTIYSKLVKMKEQGSTEGKNPKQRIVEYIESLDLTAKQKMFLYFDAAKYAYSNRPGTGNTKPFTDGGTVTEPKGNIRGIMIRLLDDISFDMYRNANMAPTLLQSEESRQIRQKDITDFLDAVFGEETSEQKDQFAAYFMGIIEDLSSQIESARMIAMSNLLIDKPQEKNSLRMNIVRSYRQTKRQFVAEGEAFERMSRKLKDPLYAAYYYGAKKYTAVANEMIYGKGQRGLDGKKQGKSLYQIFEPIFKADEKNKNNEKMKLLTLFVNCRHDMYRLMNGKGYTGYTVEECKDIVDRISEKYPEIVKAGDEIADYGRNLLRMCVESGRLSEEDYQYYTIKYPYYVPAFRYVERTYYDREGKVVRRDKDVIRKAKGGTQPDVLPLFDQMVNKTNEIVKVCKKNQLAGRLANAYRLGATEYIADVRLTEAEERKKKKAEREQKKKEKQAKKNGGVVEKNLVSEEETPMEDMIDAIGEEEENLEDIIPWYSNGVKYEIEVADEGILIGWDKLSPIKNEKDWLKVLRKFNDFRRGVLTQYNPTFWFTNGIKDLQDLFLYYPHAQRIPKYYAIAIKTMFAGNVTGLKKGIDKRRGKQTDEERKNEAKLQEYLAYGMAESSIFQYDETEGGRRKKRTRIKGALRKPLDLFDGLNFSVEQLPRFAIYLETIDRLEKERGKGKNEYTDEEIKTIAVYNASDATINFGRSGTVVKNLNTYGFTFLNAGVQGTSKFVRMFTQVKDGNVKAIAFKAIGIGVKLSIFGLSPRILNDIFYGDDDDDKGWMQDLRKLFFKDDVEKVQKEYAEMADYQKLNYYLIYIGGEWIRISRGRVPAFVRSFEFNGTKVYEGEMDALDLVIAQMDMASDTILFGNPITNNILGPCIEVWNNKDNWGREIVSEYEDKGEGFHYLEYDEDTSDLAIKLAEFGHYLTGTRFGKENSRLLDFSPKKLDHLISQYLGSYSNLIVPFLSGDQTLSEKGMDALVSLAKKFYVDPTLSNRLAGDYYDLKEEYTNIANAHDGDSPYAVVDYVFKDYNEQLKVKREMIQTITADPNMTRKQKLERVSEIRAEMNELYRQGIADAKDLLGYADANYFGKEGNREVYESWLDLTKDSDWKLSTMSDSAQAMYNEISSTGVTTDNFVKAYNFFGNLTGDKDENGKTIRNSKRDKFVTYLNSLPATAEQKKEMYYSIGGYSRNKPAPAFADGEYKQAVLTDMSAPLASGGRLSSGYGWRNCPFHGEEFHEAVDIAAPSGTAVGSALSGTVTMAAYSGGFGNTVEVTSVDANGNTIVTKYNHMSELGVEVGDVIGQGVQVGKVGSTGSSTGPHLDFRLKINGEWVDPEQYLDLTAAGIVDSTGYSAKAASGGSSSGGYASSGGGGSKSGGSKSGGGSSGGRRSSGTATASTGSRRSSTGSGSSGGSSGGVTLPTASQLSAITARSTKAPTYAKGGVTLPTAKDLARSRGTTIAANKSGTGTSRTGTTAGTRFWDENVLG